MITPLMLLLSSINPDLEYDHPVDITYLNRNDRATIMSEADRLGRLVLSETHILSTSSPNGAEIVDTAQVVNDSMVEISIATAMLLTRLRFAQSVFKKFSGGLSASEEDDIGDDNIILRLEGNPKYVYVLVRNVMESKSLTYNAKIAKIAGIYSTIIGHSSIQSSTERQQFLLRRLELHSYEQFWCRMLTRDLYAYGFLGADAITAKELEQVKIDLKNLGFYGFVNPLKMYQDFAGARVSRKSEVHVDDMVIDFLRKVSRSGGVVVP